jgi:hypothetical protein
MTVRDLVIGAVVSGAVTFATTYYFSERENARNAEVAFVSQGRERVWEAFRRYQSEAMVATRDTVSVALRERADVTFANWDTAPGASPERSRALRDYLRFYADLGVILSSDQVDHRLAEELFGPNVDWWQEMALPVLCRDYEGDNSVLEGALYAFDQVYGSQVACEGRRPRALDNRPPPSSAPD